MVYTGPKDDSYWGRSESFHYAIQNDMQFKIHEWFVSGIFYLIFSDRGQRLTMITKTSESENAVKKGLTELAEPMSPLCISS